MQPGPADSLVNFFEGEKIDERADWKEDRNDPDL